MELISSRSSSLHGKVCLPGDKSLSHRAALLAALAQGESRIENFLTSGVTQAMLEALTALGIGWELSGTTLTVQGNGLYGLRPPATPLNCGNSATTLRLLAGALAASGTQAVLTGSAGLRRRPMGRIVTPLRQMGVPVQATADATAPLELAARPPDWPLRPIHHSMSVASAQVKSCLLLAALAADGPTVIDEPGPSRDHTERMLRSMGVRVESQPVMVDDNPWFRVVLDPPRPCTLTPSDALHPLHTSLPGDFSSAAFLIVAALITPGSKITLRQVGLNPLRTGLLDALRLMGADIRETVGEERDGEPVGDLTVRYSPLHGAQVAGELVVRMIDELPILAVAAACAEGLSVVRDAAELRHKESDRISALCTELQALGVNITESEDGFAVQGGAIQGGSVDPHADHRLAMCLAVAGLAAQGPIMVSDAEIIYESFPGFLAALQSLGAVKLTTKV
jgi:3-phosphoshikimate 1-carboxyvinyltransferase